MTDRNVVTVSVIEYDMPTHTSHIGIRFSGGFDAEINFGAFRDGDYEPWGLGFGLTLGYFEDRLDLSDPIRAEFSIPFDEAQAAYDQIIAFGNDLVDANIPYSMVPAPFTRQANSNSAAAFALAILGIDHSQIDFARNMIVGFGVDFSEQKFGLPPLDYYTDKIHNRSEFPDFRDERTTPGIRNRSPDPKAEHGTRREGNLPDPKDDPVFTPPKSASSPNRSQSPVAGARRAAPATPAPSRSANLRSAFSSIEGADYDVPRRPSSFPQSPSRASLMEQYRLRALETVGRRVRPAMSGHVNRSGPRRQVRPTIGKG